MPLVDDKQDWPALDVDDDLPGRQASGGMANIATRLVFILCGPVLYAT